MNINSNEARCTSCHAGYGWKNKDFDFTDQSKVDCLVCHDKTGTYKKFPTMAGYPVKEPKKFGKTTFNPPNYNEVAQNIGRPDRKNCGSCHFYGGGDDAVKHGDLDSTLNKPSKQLDVHMGVDGQNFDCTRCHTTTRHDVAGRIYGSPAAKERKSLLEDDLAPKITCESCHSATPHKDNHKANDHTDKVACQSCHIPEFARGQATKMYWDWSTAGKKDDNGKLIAKKGPYGKLAYHTKKGDFRWEMNVVPEYYWWNGSMSTVRALDKIDDTKEVLLSWPEGSMDDPKARIMPFKVHRGKTPYDKGNKTMAVPHLFGKTEDAFWKGFDWNRSLKAGMDYVGVDYSGEYGFVDTAWAYPTTHMVAPKDNVVACGQCHAKQGRLANLAGFYMPGRDGSDVLDMIGWGVAAASLLGVLLHALLRSRGRSGNGNGKEA